MPVSFLNPGEIDIRAATIVGLNVKSSSGSIGRFGTGLKYAIAVLLRERQTIRIYSGLTAYSFKSKSIVVRGKEFALVYMQENQGPWKELSFTTEYGKDWNLEMVYRELYSNMKDEGGQEALTSSCVPAAGHTLIVVEGAAFLHVHNHRFESVLLPPNLTSLPLAPCEDIRPHVPVEVFVRPSSLVYYKGIAAYTLQKPSQFTYNILVDSPLSENRQLDLWVVNSLVIHLGKKNLYPDLTPHLFSVSEGFYEAQLNWHWESGWEDSAIEVMEKLDLSDPLRLAPTVRAELRRIKPATEVDRLRKLTLEELEEEKLKLAIETLARNSLPVLREDVFVVEDLGNKVLARVIDRKIYLTKACFRSYPLLLRALLEEVCHVISGEGDETRGFQNFVLDQMTRLLCGTSPESTVPRKPFSDEIEF